MKKYFGICLLLVFGNLGYSQNNTERKAKNSVGIRIGYNQGYLKDLNFSPLNYNEGGILYALNYENESLNGKGKFYVDMEFSSSQLETPVSEFLTSSLIMANLDVAYVRKVTAKGNLSIFLGGQYSSYLQIMDWRDLESFSYIASHGIGLKGLLAYRLNSKNALSSSLFIPIFEFLVRPPYNGLDEEIIENQDNIARIVFSGKPASIDHYLAFNWKLDYLFTLSRRFDLTARYSLRYQNIPEINEVIHLQNQLLVGLNIKF